MLASEIIKQSCCGQLLDVRVCELVKMVESLEGKAAFLEHQLNNAIAELQRRGKR